MKKIIYNKFDKREISKLPIEAFEGKIEVVNTAEEAAEAVKYLMGQPILGLDTETRPSFKKGQVNKVALLQVSSKDVCYLFRLNKLGITPEIKYLLEETKITKIGLSLVDDIHALGKRLDFNPAGYIDIQNIISGIGIVDMSLQKIYANLFKGKISKSRQLSNWEADVLTPAQQRYAATDAWACIKIYEEYCRLKDTHDYDLIIVPEPEPVVKEPVLETISTTAEENQNK